MVWAGILLIGSVIAPSGTQTAIANGDTRTIRLYHVHTKETIEATFRVNGQYDTAVLKQLNWFLRDWRRDEPTTMDPRLFDVVWETYRSAGGGSEYVTVMSAYRSPETNAMLRRRSRAVAEYSQHMLGKAMDTSMPGMSMAQIRETGMRMQRGGVGYYPSAGTPFVHLDVGSVRSWPRMNYDQLVRLFPDGKTVHLPSNGQPLARYEEARAEIAALGGVTPPSSRSTGFFAWLFGGGARDGGDDEDTSAAAPVQTASRRGRGGVQTASVSPRASFPQAAGGSSASTNDGGRDFFIAQATRAGRDAPQAIATQAPAAPVVAPVPAATLAQAEADLARSEPLAVAPASQPTRVAVASLETPAQADGADETGTLFAAHPAPPRRPSDLFALIDAPLPPSRPVELASGSAPGFAVAAIAYANIDPGLRRGDPIGSLLDRSVLPATLDRKAAAGRPVVGAIGSITGLRAARSSAQGDATAIVPARLDRSNFRAMTGQLPAVRMTTQTVGGPTLTAARGAARAERAMLTPVASGTASSFGAHASDLSTSGFAPVRPLQAGLAASR